MSDKITLKNVGGRTFQVGVDDNRDPVSLMPKKTAVFARAEAKRLMGLYPEEFEVVSGDIDAEDSEKSPTPVSPLKADKQEALTPTAAGPTDYNAMTMPALKKILDEKNVAYKPQDNKATLVKLVEEAMEPAQYVVGEVYTINDVQYVAAKVGETEEIGLLPVDDLPADERQKLVDEGKLTA